MIVTFAVDGANATAAKARELGGEVVAGPAQESRLRQGGGTESLRECHRITR